jgi:hypothetical protein
MGDAVLSDYNVIIRMVTEYNSPKENQEFMATFQEQTGLPTNVVLSAEGQTQRLANVSCGSSNCLAIYSSLTVTITPAAAPAA